MHSMQLIPVGIDIPLSAQLCVSIKRGVGSDCGAGTGQNVGLRDRTSELRGPCRVVWYSPSVLTRRQCMTLINFELFQAF